MENGAPVLNFHTGGRHIGISRSTVQNNRRGTGTDQAPHSGRAESRLREKAFQIFPGNAQLRIKDSPEQHCPAGFSLHNMQVNQTRRQTSAERNYEQHGQYCVANGIGYSSRLQC